MGHGRCLMVDDDYAPPRKPLKWRPNATPRECGVCHQDSDELSDEGTILFLCPRCRAVEFRREER